MTGDATGTADGQPAAIALIDGEHYPPVVRAALQSLRTRFRFVGALFLGGREKLRFGSPTEVDRLLAAEYGLPVTMAPESSGEQAEARLLECVLRFLERTGARVVVDLSDEPVVGYKERFLLMSAAAARGVWYVGADFELRPQPLERLGSAPTLGVIGTGKRVGKTAISGYLARQLSAAGERVVVLAMGRGGPAEPELIDGAAGVTAADLLAASRRGRHAASDHYEDAALANVLTVGSRRCGGGLAGAPFDSTVARAVPLLRSVPASIVLIEGSGAAIPPVWADATVCVASAAQSVEYVAGYLGTFRLLIADLLVVTMCEPPLADAAALGRLIAAAHRVVPGLLVLPTVFRPRPLGDVRGRRVAYFTTAPSSNVAALRAYLQDVSGADVVVASGDLADRPALVRAVRRAQKEAEVFVTEIKAAAIDVVAEAAAEAGKDVVFCDNEPVAVEGGDLKAACVDVAARAQQRFATARPEPEDVRRTHG